MDEDQEQMEQDRASLQEALDSVHHALTLVQDVMAHSSERSYFESYLVGTFKTLLGQGNPYDASILKLAESVGVSEDELQTSEVW